jgi:hypothetical protein
MALALTLIEPSVPVVTKYLGTGGALVFVAVGLAAIMGLPYWMRLFMALTPRQADLMAAVAILSVLMVVLFVYPRANVHLPMRGSDRDDALEVATSALLHGRYPYRQLTYLGNPITPLPGALLLAAPFVLLGNVALVNVFWTAALFVTLRHACQDSRLSLLILTMVLVAPAVMQEIATGGDMFANGVYAAIFLWLVASAIPRTNVRTTNKIAVAALLGMGLASRFTYPYVLPLVFAYLSQSMGWQRAAAWLSVIVVIFCGLTVPFYLWAPDAFAPLHMRSKLAGLPIGVPHAAVVAPVLTALFALFVARYWERTRMTLLIGAALIVAFPTVLLAGALLFRNTAIGFEYMSAGLTFTGLAALGIAEALSHSLTLSPRSILQLQNGAQESRGAPSSEGAPLRFAKGDAAV